jgi:hypothetical protein
LTEGTEEKMPGKLFLADSLPGLIFRGLMARVLIFLFAVFWSAFKYQPSFRIYFFWG